MPDPLMDQFRGGGDGGEQICPRVDANLSCELQRVLCISPRSHIAIGPIKTRPSKLELIGYYVSIL